MMSREEIYRESHRHKEKHPSLKHREGRGVNSDQQGKAREMRDEREASELKPEPVCACQGVHSTPPLKPQGARRVALKRPETRRNVS